MGDTTAPLSFAQERLWFLEQFSPGTATYNVPMAVDVEGPLDHHVMERALGEILRRHEPLRTVYVSDGGLPRQYALPYEPFVLPVEDVRAAENSEEHIRQLIASEVRRPFNLERGPVFRARLLRADEMRHVLVLTVHHIAFDGWSMGVFFRELSALYVAFAAGQPSPLAPLPLRYADFAVAQREQLTSAVANRQMAYWREHLRAPLPVLTLPADRPRPQILTSRGQRAVGSVPEAVMARLQEVGRQNGATLFMAVAAAYAVFLHRLSAQTDITIGTPIANRMRREAEPLIGFFVNSLALRISVAPGMTVRDVLGGVTESALNAYANQDIPFERIVETINPKRDLSRAPIFQTLLTFNNTPNAIGDSVVAGPVTLRRRLASTETAKVDLTVTFRHGGDGRVVTFETNADLFDADTGARMLRDFCAWLAAVPDSVGSRIEHLPAMGAPASGSAALHVTEGFNPARISIGESAPYPRDATVAQLFERQAMRTPDAPALADGAVVWTYREVNQRANRLAHVLRCRCGLLDNAAAPAIGVCLERSSDAVVTLIAILKAGGAYVPLDPAFPPARLAALAARAELRLIVASEHAVERVASAGAPLIVLDREAAAMAGAPATDPPGAAANALAYILFTSGTTGAPKPVGVPHRAIVRLVYGLPSIPLGEGQTVLHASPLSFDAATFEIWGPLLHGGCVAIAPPLMLGAEAVAHTIAAHKVTVMWLTASLFNAIVDERVEALSPLRYLISGGEALSVRHVSRAMRALPETRLFNGYGPTEATTFTTCHEISPSEASNATGIPIGTPLLNTRVYVLDEHRQPVGPGDAGELWIGGDGLALGYLDDPERTADRFVPDPFADDPEARMFRSGDRVRARPDGALEFLGRLDEQIKLRGFRIEPGDVEAAVCRHPAVAQCAVVPVESRVLGRALVAFYVPAAEAGEPAAPQHLREFLRTLLPEYMIPARWASVDALPLLGTGKVDRQSLKARAIADDDDRAAPAPIEHRGDVDSALASLWRNVLGVAEVRGDDNFFDCGGHSLLVVQMLAQVQSTFGVEVPVRALFEAPTLAGLSRVITDRTNATGASLSSSEGVEASSARRSSSVALCGAAASAGRPSAHRKPARTAADFALGLLEIWRELLGAMDIGPGDDFFDLGGHSLLATRLAAAIAQRFAIDIPLSALFTHGTIEAQARLLVEAMPVDGWSPIVPIQPQGSEPPFFIVHGISGEVISFQPLARHLGPDIPLYGIEADRREQGGEALTVEEVAARYVAAMTRAVPDGPYRLAGYSAGGLIAFEMARQLRDAGRPVASLVMLDAPASATPVREPRSPASLARLVKNGAYWLVDDDFLRAGWRMQRTRVQQGLKTLSRRSAGPRDAQAVAAHFRDRLEIWGLPLSITPFIERLMRMLRAYQPQPYAGAMTVIAARTHSLFFVTGPDLGWTPLVEGGVTTHTVRGAHDTILREPRVSAVAAIIRETLSADR